jgi:hypothetical protein
MLRMCCLFFLLCCVSMFAATGTVTGANAELPIIDCTGDCTPTCPPTLPQCVPPPVPCPQAGYPWCSNYMPLAPVLVYKRVSFVFDADFPGELVPVLRA